METNFEKTVNAFSMVVTESETLGQIKIVDVLKQFPDYKNVISAKITEPIGQKFKEIRRYSDEVSNYTLA